MAISKKVFVRKSGANGAGLYKWSPDTSEKKAKKDSGAGVGKYFCTTPIGSQGNDFITTYVYNVVILNGIGYRHAYVQCDYVK
jgi:hypothetical protein